MVDQALSETPHEESKVFVSWLCSSVRCYCPVIMSLDRQMSCSESPARSFEVYEWKAIEVSLTKESSVCSRLLILVNEIRSISLEGVPRSLDWTAGEQIE